MYKIVVFDMRLVNIDRNGGNILVCWDENNEIKFVLIDYGYCLFEKVKFVFLIIL